MDLSHVAATLDVDVVVAGRIRLIQIPENPPPGAYAGMGIVDVTVFDARVEETVLRRRVKIRLETDDSPAQRPSRPTRDARRRFMDLAAHQITELVLSKRASAEGPTENPSETAGGET